MTFLHPFSLAGVEGEQAAGTYAVETLEEPIEGLSFVAYRRVSTTIVLPRSRRVSKALLDAAEVVIAPSGDRLEKRLSGGRGGGGVRIWRCQTERAQGQAVAAEVERLVERGGVMHIRKDMGLISAMRTG